MLDFAQRIRVSWADGQNWTEEAKVRVEDYEDLADLDLESISTFYEAMDERDSTDQ